MLPFINPPEGFSPIPVQALEGTLIDRFEAMASTHPEEVAVRDSASSLTYRELNQMSNALAGMILSARGQKGEVIAFLAYHNLETIMLIWGTLKAGKTYLALNPEDPIERIALLLKETGATCLLTRDGDGKARDIKRKRPGLALLSLPADPDPVENNPGLRIPTDTPPYLSYTSGTTGKPKVIRLEHRGLLNQALDYSQDLGFNARDSFALLNPLSFGGGSFAFLGAFMNGGRLCLYDLRREGLGGIHDWIDREGITVLNMPPPVFRNIFSNLPPGRRFASVRLIILSGDTMIRREVDLCRAHFNPDCGLINMLAMSEVGLVSRHRIDLAQDAGQVIPVGTPFASVDVSIVNEAGEVLSPGQEGLIRISTRYLSRDPRLESNAGIDGRLVPDEATGRLVFRSEDLGRMDADGVLEHLGRNDSVLKIHGLRIDLAEVEAHLYAHPSVRDAVVISVPARRHDASRQIVAYIVPSPGEDIAQADLYKYLTWKLPQYMVPARYVFLDRLPLNPNGKVDRARLPEPDWAQTAAGTVYVKPRNSTEAALAKMWQEILDVKRIGVHDRFFTLGGDSFSGLRLLARIEAELHVRFPLQALVSGPSVAEMADLIDKEKPMPAHGTITLLREGGQGNAIYMIPGGGRTGISLMDTVSRLKPGRKVYSLEYPGMNGYLKPMDDLQTLAAFFIREMRGTQAHGPYHLMGPCLGGTVAFEMACQLATDDGEPAGMLVLMDTTPPVENADRTFRMHRAEGSGEGRRSRRGLSRTWHRSLKKVRLHFWGGARGEATPFVSRLNAAWNKVRFLLMKMDNQRHLAQRLDSQTLEVYDRLQIARKNYHASRYPGTAVLIFCEQVKGSGQEQAWGEYLGQVESHYIPGTSHYNLFSLENSLDSIAGIINIYLSQIV